MTPISIQKQCLVIGKTPPDWPSGWAFPGPNPPGWPKRTPDNFGFLCSYDNAILSIQCRDEFNEPTDAMLGQFFEITASGERGGIVRLRTSNSQVWSRKALIAITAPTVSVPLQFEKENLGGEKATAQIELFGYANGGVALRAQVAI